MWGSLTGVLIVFEGFISTIKIFEKLEREKIYGKYLSAACISVYLTLVMSFDMAVFIMGLERVLKFYMGFLISLEGTVIE